MDTRHVAYHSQELIAIPISHFVLVTATKICIFVAALQANLAALNQGVQTVTVGAEPPATQKRDSALLSPVLSAQVIRCASFIVLRETSVQKHL